MKNWPTATKKWLAFLLLSLTAFLAGSGAEIACVVRDEIVGGGGFRQYGQPIDDSGEPFVMISGPGAISNLYGVGVSLVIMAVCICALALFFRWVLRDRFGWLMLVLPLMAFGWSAWRIYQFAWPVCNAF